MRLDDVVMGKADFRAVIDEIAGEAGRVIAILRKYTGTQVDLSKSLAKRGNGTPKRARKTSADDIASTASRDAKPKRTRSSAKSAASAHDTHTAAPPASSTRPTERMVAFAKRLAADKNAKLPRGFDTDFETCRNFLDQNAGR